MSKISAECFQRASPDAELGHVPPEQLRLAFLGSPIACLVWLAPGISSVPLGSRFVTAAISAPYCFIPDRLSSSSVSLEAGLRLIFLFIDVTSASRPLQLCTAY
ncbi:hypothetical protein VTN96DRAFT_1172 [Rasamsonia emersonii]